MQKEMADIFILIARIDKTAPTQQLQAPVKRKSMNASAFFLPNGLICQPSFAWDPEAKCFPVVGDSFGERLCTDM